MHVFWGDERFVPSGDRRRNEAMAKETLLDHVPCPPANIHPISSDAASSAAAADKYEATLRRRFSSEWPQFDLVLLGLGADGHTASLFPGSSALDETTRWAVDATAPANPPSRVTLTLPVFNGAALTFFSSPALKKPKRCAACSPAPTQNPAGSGYSSVTRCRRLVGRSRGRPVSAPPPVPLGPMV